MINISLIKINLLYRIYNNFKKKKDKNQHLCNTLNQQKAKNHLLLLEISNQNEKIDIC